MNRRLIERTLSGNSVCSRGLWASRVGVRRSFAPSMFYFSCFFPSALSSLLTRIRSIRARAVPRTLYSAIENEFIPSALPRSRYPNQRCMTPNDVYRADGLPRTNCIYLHIENILTFLANFRAINKSIYSRVI